MSKDPKSVIEEALRSALKIEAPDHADMPIVLERPKRPDQGDLSSPLALQLAKRLKMKPLELAERLKSSASVFISFNEYVESTAIAPPGFINFKLRGGAKLNALQRALAEGTDYGSRRLAKREKWQVEFVSANPTGPLHVGHGRGAAYGDSLARLLEFAGHEVTREFYVNDAGRQMDILALSVWLRYLQARGKVVPFPEDGYRGDYVRDIAAKLAGAHAVRFERNGLDVSGSLDDPDKEIDRLVGLARSSLGADWNAIHRFALDEMLADQRSDLDAFRISFDRWFSEQSLYDDGLIDKAVKVLEERGHLYEKDAALWFRSTTFGDEKDRVVRRENGQFTYFASDIAYHLEKFQRGFDRVIDIWGADHHGYVARVKGALQAFGLDAGKLDIALVQFAVLYRGGEKVAMGKRSGEFVTLRELREEVGTDAARFFYVLRKSDQHLDFDLDLAKSESNENPVYYVQYAHARVCSVFAQWGGDSGSLSGVELDPLDNEKEMALAKRIGEFPELIATSARELAPHSIAFYLRELAAEFHSYYNAERILVDDEALRAARLALCAAVRQTLANGLSLLGVSAPEKM